MISFLQLTNLLSLIYSHLIKVGHLILDGLDAVDLRLVVSHHLLHLHLVAGTLAGYCFFLYSLPLEDLVLVLSKDMCQVLILLLF